MSSTNFRSILIFASCVVGTCNIQYIDEFLFGGSYFWSTIMVSVVIQLIDRKFGADRRERVDVARCARSTSE